MGKASSATTVRAALAVALLAGFYLVGVGLTAGLAWLSVWLWLAFPGQVAHDVSYLLAATAVGLAVPTWRMVRARPEPPVGLPLTRLDAPGLWSLVEAAAQAVGTRAPDEIRLAAEANAGVREDARLLGLRPGRRHLYVGVPLLRACEVGQLRAVLAHELGHYSRRHTRLGPLTYRGMRVIVHTIDVVGPTSVAGWVLSGYAALYSLVSSAVMRQMELEADRASVRVAGRAATVLALRGTPRVRSAWESLLAGYVRRNRGEGYTPAELLAWYGWLIEQTGGEPDRAGPRRARSSRWDSHPTVRVRIAAIDREPDTAVAPDPRPGDVLVADPATMAAALRADSFGAELEQVAQQEAEHDANRLYHAAAEIAGTRRRGLGSVLDLLADGRGGELRLELPPIEPVPEPGRPHPGRPDPSRPDPSRPDPSRPDPHEDDLVEAACAAVAAAVVRAGGARWRHSWSRPMALVRDDRPVALRPLVAAACAGPAGVPPLRELLLDAGVDEASVVGWAAPGRVALDIGLVFRTLDGAGPSTTMALLLPDELFLLAYGPTGRRRVNVAAFEAVLAAGALAELRLRGRVGLAATADAAVVVEDTAPTGDRFLDSVLARVAAGRQRPAYEWVSLLGPDVTRAVARRLDLRGLYEPRSAGLTHPVNHVPYDRDRVRDTRSRVLRALETDSPDAHGRALGALLWGAELDAAVLGRAELGHRRRLARIARRDRLALAVRTATGLGTRLPEQSAGG